MPPPERPPTNPGGFRHRDYSVPVEEDEGNGGGGGGRFEGRMRAAEREIARLPDLYRRVGKIEDRSEDSGNHEIHMMQQAGLSWKQALFGAFVAAMIGTLSAGCSALLAVYATESAAPAKR